MVNEYDDIVNEENNENQINTSPGGVENEYDSIVQEDTKERSVNLKESLRVASESDPNKHSEVYSLAKETKLPTRAVERNIDKIKKFKKQKEMDYSNLMKVTPGLGKWLENPDNAKIAHTELSPLKKIEQSSRAIATNRKEERFTKEIDKAFESGYQGLKASSGALGLAYGLGDKREMAELIANANKRTNELYNLAPKYVQRFRKNIDRESKELNESVDTLVDSYELAKNGDPRKGDLFKAIMDFNAGIFDTIGEAVDMFTEVISNPRGTIYTSAESMANSAPALATGAIGAKAGAVGGSVVPGIGTAIGGAVGFGAGTFAGAVPTEMGAWINSKLSEKGYDSTNPDQILKAFEDKKFIEEIKSEAVSKGVTTAGVDAVFNMFAGKFLKGATGKGLRSRVSAGAKDIASQMAGEAISEGAGQASATGKVDVAEALNEGLISLGSSVTDVAIGAKNYARDTFAKDPIDATEEIVKQTQDSLQAIQDAQQLEQIGVAVKEAQNTSSVPGAIQEIIESASGGEEVNSVFMQSDDFDSYWSEKGQSPQEKASEISEEVAESYNQARKTGEAIEIPLKDYVEKIGKTEDFEGLLDVTRTKVDGPSLREAKEFMEDMPGLLKEVAEEASNQDLTFEESGRAVKRNISDQLIEAGMKKKDADLQASLYEGFYKRRAERLGITPEEAFQKRNVTVERINQNIVKEDDTFKTLMKRRKEQEKNKELQQTPINKLPKELKEDAEFLIDSQIDNMIREIEQAEAGQRNITGVGAEQRVTATQSTFPTYYKSINARNKEDFAKIAKSKKGRRYNRLRDIAIERLKNGYESREDGLVMPDNDFRSIVGLPLISERGEKMDDGFELFQGVDSIDRANTDTDEFNNWFKDSVVSDSEGEPLTVYHGSANDFSIFDIDKLGQQGRAEGPGFYFTTDKTVASGYKRDGGKLFEVYLSIQKPISYNQENFNEDTISEILERVAEYELQEDPDLESVYDTTLFSNGYDTSLAINNETALDFISEMVSTGASSRSVLNAVKDVTGHDGFESNGFSDQGGGGKIYVAFSPEQIKSINNKGDFDSDNPDIYNQGDDKARGRIKILENDLKIELLQKADPSTFIHETGHLFLEELRADFIELKNLPGESESKTQFMEDAQTILDFLGVDSFDKIEVEHHEKWARGFEKFLGEGKAPTNELQKAFNRFRTWIISVYRDLMNLNVELTDDVRQVMGRMLATNEEIQRSARETGARGLFEDARSVGMNEKMAKRYEEAWQNWRVKAEQKMTSELVNQWQKEDKKFLDKARKEERAKVEELVSEDPIYNAIDELQKGLMDDGTVIKLDSNELKSLYGDDILNFLPKRISRQDNTYSLDYVAGLFGFESGKQMIDAMTDIPTKKEYINQLTEKKMQEKYWDKMLPESELQEKAVDAIHSDDRVELLYMDLQHLASEDITLTKDIIKKVTRRPPSKTQVKREAESIISEKKLSDLKPYLFQRAEAKNAKLAGEALAKGDLQGAFDYKEKELLNHELYRESKKAKEFQEKSVKKFKKASQKDEKLAKSRDMELVNAGRSILTKYGLMKATGNENQNLDLIRDYDPDAFETVRALIESVDIPPKKAKDLTFEELKTIRDTFDALWDLSRESRMMEIDGKKLEIKDVSEELMRASDRFKKKKERTEYDRTITDAEKFKNDVMGLKALVRRFESWIDVMDGGKMGTFRKYLFTPISEGTDKFLLAKSKIVNEIVKEAEQVKTFDLRKKIQSKELGFEFKNKGELLGALIHTGNESNLKKLLVGRGWGSLNDDGTLNTDKWDAFIERMWAEEILTKKDYDFVQSLWDKMESIKPETQKAHKKLFGFYFNEITSNEIKTPWGTYKGGYAPAKIDPDAVTDRARKSELEQYIKGHQSYTYPASGGKGFTKSREDNYNKPLSLDINLVPQHIEETLRFTYVKPAVVDTAKVLLRQDFKDHMAEIDPSVIEKLIKPALNRADKNATQNSDPSSDKLLNRGFSFLKSSSSMQIMFANIVNTTEQFSGLGLSATKISPKELALAGNRYMRNHKEVAEFVSEKSNFMKARQDDQIFEMERQMKTIFDDKSNFKKVKEFAVKHTYFMQSFTQNIVDNITWQASYNESIANGLSEKDSIRKADSDVRLTQSSRRPMDISNIESNQWFGFFNMFQNFFNMMLNLNVSNFQNLINEDIPIQEKFKKGTYLYLMGFMQVAVIGQLLRKGASGSFDEDDDGEYTDDLYDVFIGSQVDLATAMIPMAGGAVNAGLNRMNDKMYDDRVSASPAISILSTTAGLVPTLIKTAEGNRNPKFAIRDSLSVLGLMTGLPLYPASKPISYVIDVNRGEKDPSGPIDYTRGLITGK